MTAQALLVVAVGVFLAYANGANDVSKGIATLVGSGVTDYRRAIAWGTMWTAVGGVLGAVFGGAMLATFGNEFLAPGTTPTFAAALAALIGAAAWVLLGDRGPGHDGRHLRPPDVDDARVVGRHRGLWLGAARAEPEDAPRHRARLDRDAAGGCALGHGGVRAG